MVTYGTIQIAKPFLVWHGIYFLYKRMVWNMVPNPLYKNGMDMTPLYKNGMEYGPSYKNGMEHGSFT